MPQVSVIIADDHQVVRAGLRQIIASQPDLRVVADCRTGKEVIAALKEQVCNVLLLDLLGFPTGDYPAVRRWLTAIHSRPTARGAIGSSALRLPGWLLRPIIRIRKALR